MSYVPAILGWRNYAAAATVLGWSSQVATLPAANAVTRRLGQVWRTSTGGAAHVRMDLGAEVDLGQVWLIRSNLSAGGYGRVRASLTDPFATSALSLDSGPMAQIDTARGLVIFPVVGPARYLRVDLIDAGVPYHQLGMIAVLNAWQPRRTFAMDWRQGFVDLSTRVVTEGGAVFVDERPARRRDVLRWGAVDDDEVEPLRDLVREVRAGTDVFVNLRPGLPDAATWANWGLVDELPTLQPAGPRLWSFGLSLTERL